MEILDAIQNRRSTRKYDERQVAVEELSAVLEAARMAPSGMNIRKCKIYVIRRKETLERLNAAVIGACKRGNSDGISKERAQELDPATYSFYYGAPTLLLITNQKAGYNSFSDTGCLLENAMLQAAEMGLGTCWLNNVRRAQKDAEVCAMLEEFGVQPHEEITGGLAIGYPAADTPPLERRSDSGNDVVFVDVKKEKDNIFGA